MVEVDERILKILGSKEWDEEARLWVSWSEWGMLVKIWDSIADGWYAIDAEQVENTYEEVNWEVKDIVG
jgi:hypothetical protein